MLTITDKNQRVLPNGHYRFFKSTLLFVIGLTFGLLTGCSSNGIEGSWDYKLYFDEDPSPGTMRIGYEGGVYSVVLLSFELGKIELNNLKLTGNQLSGNFEKWGMEMQLEGTFKGDQFEGNILVDEEEIPFMATRLIDNYQEIDRSGITYILSDNDLEETELNIDHAGIIEELDEESYERGSRIYNSNCINCHGSEDIEGSIPLSLKFWEQSFKAGKDPFSMYQSITKGFGAMPPQLTLTPQEKYDVITFVREEFVRSMNEDQYYKVTPKYLASLPKGTSRGPESKPYHPWKDQDYGNFFINTYELVDEETGPERYHSPGPTPFPDEDYSKNNFAYKGIAVRLDEGPGGVSDGNSWMIFDHDLMRVAGGWTGEGFIDWDGILLNDRHETYPRTIGKLHFETPVGPGWANPADGSWDDPRFTARDGRQFGPLPKVWANYKGLYYHGKDVVISYTIGSANVLELLGMEKSEDQTVFTRTLNISPSNSLLKMRVAKSNNKVQLTGSGASLSEEDGYFIMKVNRSQAAKVKLFIADESVRDFDNIVSSSSVPQSLAKYTKGGPAHYPQVLPSVITPGSEDGMFAVDQLTPPFENPWDARMKLSGIDFLKDGNKAVGCTTDGDVFLITGLTDGSSSLQWKRIASGLFQPLGIKVLNEKIYVICRDQLVRLQDLNGDDETDFYESFNHDHQVTDHFHEFAMGLQADNEGNFYYAKSGRHAREALIPQHGTLIKVSKDGSTSEIIASGFRAANGVCLNPDGSFLVTDQQGYWNPMNRVNWIEIDGEKRFYGNMWGYDPPQDTTRAAMEPPMIWIDMEYDRSPSELLWVDSEKWGPLNGSLLSFSYGYGKIQLVYHEKVNGQMQGGVIDVPGMTFYTGVMRGRFHPHDQHLYLCGMAAWSTSQNMRGGDLYRIRYTGNTITMPVELNALQTGMKLTFADELDAAKATDLSRYTVQSWDLVRSSDYGSDRYNIKTLNVSEVKLEDHGKAVVLVIEDIAPVDVMTIEYDIATKQGTVLQGTVQNTIHNLGLEPIAQLP